MELLQREPGADSSRTRPKSVLARADLTLDHVSLRRPERRPTLPHFQLHQPAFMERRKASDPNSYECPDFFQLPIDGDRTKLKWVLIRGNGKYSVGTFDGFQFTEETPQFDSDAGPNFYATQSWENTPDGRRVQAAWMNGGVYPDMPFNQQVTFPRELTLRTTAEGPRLFRQPIREIEILQDREENWTNRTLTAGQSVPLAPAGDLFQ